MTIKDLVRTRIGSQEMCPQCNTEQQVVRKTYIGPEGYEYHGTEIELTCGHLVVGWIG